MKNIRLIVIVFTASFFLFPKLTYAVIPPDFIFNIGTQVAQFFSVIVVFMTAVFGAFFQFFKTRYFALKNRKIILSLIVFGGLVTALGLSYMYALHKQKETYLQWMEESEENAMSGGTTDDLNNADLEKSNRMVNDENNQLNIGIEGNENIDTSDENFVTNISLSDDMTKFITKYYRNIANGDLRQAYQMSKKSVDFNTFESWYLKTSKITLDKMVRIDAKRSSIELTLYEGESFTRYGVLMTLSSQDNRPVKIEKSEVKILLQGLVKKQNITADEIGTSQQYDFFQENENLSIILTNEKFQDMINNQRDKFIVLDARENIEYENGYFPNSSHVRFADLKAGRWIELPKDKYIYVLCWSGIRGKEVAEFLRTKKIAALYLENGANGWVEGGGKWIGDIKFNKKYNDARYKIVLNTKDVKKKVKDGVVLIDSREPYKFNQWHIAGSFNIPIMYVPTISLEEVFNQIPKNSKIITVCDGYVNCFDAKLTGVELERRGHQFLGRYNKPWKYEK